MGLLSFHLVPVLATKTLHIYENKIQNPLILKMVPQTRPARSKRWTQPHLKYWIWTRADLGLGRFKVHVSNSHIREIRTTSKSDPKSKGVSNLNFHMSVSRSNLIITLINHFTLYFTLALWGFPQNEETFVGMGHKICKALVCSNTARRPPVSKWIN